jgi:hypothetical protein
MTCPHCREFFGTPAAMVAHLEARLDTDPPGCSTASPGKVPASD